MRGPKYWSWAPEGLLRDPLIRRMGAEAFGGFMSLLIEAWFDPQGSLPNDQEELAILSRLGVRWSKHGPAILSRWKLAEDGRWHHDIVDDAISRASKKSEQAQKAVEAREEKKQEDRKVELVGGSNDHQTIIQGKGKGKGKEKEKENIGGKPPYPQEGIASRYSPGFEAFWEAWRGLRPRTTLNKKQAFESYKKALQRGATDDDLVQAVKVFGRYISHREKSGKVDQRDFIPMPETWLNQDRWTSEYPEEVVETLVGEPVVGRDFYWDNVPDPSGKSSNMVGRFRLGPNGERTGEIFISKKWREEQKKTL